MRKEKFHFIGICGTAMGSVAAGMKSRGFEVSGSDRAVYPPMSDFLIGQGITLSESYREENIGDATVVVVGNAISRGNVEAEAVLNRRLRYLSLPEVLKEYFLRGKQNLVMTGTHGKTTTSSLLAWILESAGKNPSFMIGGIPRNFGMGARFVDSQHVVMEGDEYDTAFFDKRSKFLHYLPEVVVVNNIEFDHADIYHNLDEIKLTFQRLLNIIPSQGIAYLNGDDANCLAVGKTAPGTVKTVGLGENCDLRISEIDYQPEASSFTLEGERYRVPMVGEFNVRNAAMAVCAALFAGIEPKEIRAGLESFQGIARRQEEKGTARGVTVVDDFAHHPTAIQLVVAGLRQKYPQRRLWVIFEPRSNTTRRKVFQNELASALSSADLVVLPAISDPEKVALDDRLDPEKLMADIRQNGTPAWYLPDLEEIVNTVSREAKEGDVVAVISNGGFGGIHGKLLAALGLGAD